MRTGRQSLESIGYSATHERRDTLHAQLPSGTLRAKVHAGPPDWRKLVEWLSEDGVISSAEAQRTIARCSQVQSAQAPLIRLASVSMVRVADGKPLDIETIAQWLAGRAGLNYLRIDPLKVDVGKVADTMSAVYAERHKVLPVQVTPGRW